MIGSDYLEEPLKAAERLLAATAAPELSHAVKFQVADVYTLPFPDNSFDLVHAHQVLEHLGDPVAGLREMRRVAKPNGIVACREWASTSFYPTGRGLEEWEDLFLRFIAANGGHPNAGRCMHVWAEEAGFPLSKVKRSAGTWCFSTPEERQYFGGSMAKRMRDFGDGPAGSTGFASKVVEKGFASREHLEALAHAWDGFVADEHAWSGFLHGEILCWK